MYGVKVAQRAVKVIYLNLLIEMLNLIHHPCKGCKTSFDRSKACQDLAFFIRFFSKLPKPQGCFVASS
jgi:hypothetical protein